ncbi:hypothetical protein JI750_16515 [Flavobacterium sp. GN10]|uniref:Uncharacterized protein n=1 Tax=Flavobacterium tagetis TaxID=2801336 RepID=A0ABS1KGM1_9FLAO|nr:hypothetical protein [Flavobacterium tagetis]MBL0738500.1 hypothetical protein [Flavobacterium tagetis]
METKINLIISVIALFASIYAIYYTRIDINKQLRMSKLEEILEIITLIDGYYASLFNFFNDAREIRENLENGKKITPELEKKIMLQNRFIEIVKEERLVEKATRLRTLSDAYLPNSNNLKIKINTISMIYYNMHLYILRKNLPNVKELSMIPKPVEMRKFIQKIETLVVKEMKLGYKTFTKEDHMEYFHNQFKKDIERM